MTTYDSLIEAATRIEDAIYNGTHGSQVKEADPKGKKIALGGTSKNSEVNILSDGKPKTLSTFTLFGITLSRTPLGSISQDFDRIQNHWCSV
jgi:hypothetical protein